MKWSYKVCWILALLLVLVSSVQAERFVRILQHASGEGFPEFKSSMMENGWANEEGIYPEKLCQLAYDYAKQKQYLDLVDPQYRHPKIYCKKFLDFAFRSKPGDVIPDIITWEFFRWKGQGEIGWRLPVIDSVAEELNRVTVQLGQLQQEVSSGRQSIDSVSKQVEQLQGSMSKLAAEVAEKDVATQAAVSALNQGLEAMQKGEFTEEMLEVIAVQVGVETSQFRDQLNTIQDEVSNLWTWYVLSGILFLGLVLVTVSLLHAGVRRDLKNKHAALLYGEKGKDGLLRRATKLEVEQSTQQEQFNELSNQVGTFQANLIAIQSLVGSHSRDIESLQNDYHELAEAVGGYRFDETLVQPDKLKQLEIGSGGVEVVLSHTETPDYSKHLMVERTGETQVTIRGAVRQKGGNTPLVVDSLEGVPAAIYRAAKQGRVVGVVQSQTDSAT